MHKACERHQQHWYGTCMIMHTYVGKAWGEIHSGVHTV
jgi:hypothetical protein